MNFTELRWFRHLAGDRFGGLCTAVPALEVSGTEQTDQGTPNLAGSLHSLLDLRHRAPVLR